MEEYKLLYSLEGHNPKYGICQHSCVSEKWIEIKNCCNGPESDNDWYVCGGSAGFPLCDENNEGLIIYTDCFPKTDLL